ncbi:MAG: endo-1,4-beta-xylanase [Opitutales bacterium]
MKLAVLIGLLGSAFVVQNAFAQADDDWRARAEARIRMHRTSEVALAVADATGEPLAEGTEVRVRMTKSAFHWSVATGAGSINDWYNDGRLFQYYDELPGLANTTQATSAQQWWMTRQKNWQRSEQRFVAWARARGLAIRGHNMFWAHPNEDFVVPEPYRSWFTGDAPPTLDHEPAFRSAVEEHIRWIGRRMPFIYEWDVVNEPIHRSAAFRYLGYNTISEQAELISEWLAIAREAAPQASLVINEFGVVHDEGDTDERYLELCRAIVEGGGELDGVGFQMHQWNGNRRRHPADVYRQIDAFAQLGLTLSVTEYDTYGGNWDEPSPWWNAESPMSADEIKGRWFEDMLVTFYSHPACTTFQTWMKADGVIRAPKGVFFFDDFSLKPQGEAWHRFVLGEWQTDETLSANAQGTVSLRAHHGEYEVSATVNGSTQTGVLTIGPKTSEAVVALAADLRPQIVSEELRPGLEHVPYFGVALVESGDQPLTFNLVDAPDWLSIDADGIISGEAPKGTKSVNLEVVVEDADGDIDRKAFELTFWENPPRFVGIRFPEAEGTDAAPPRLVATYGEPPYRWELLEGPTWVKVTADGFLHTDPNEAGREAQLRVKVTDAHGESAEGDVNVSQ